MRMAQAHGKKNDHLIVEEAATVAARGLQGEYGEPVPIDEYLRDLARDASESGRDKAKRARARVRRRGSEPV